MFAILHEVNRRLVLVPRVEGDPDHLGVLLAHFLGIALDALVALEDAGLGGVPHHLPLHHRLVFVARLELGVGAEAGHLAQLISPRGGLAKAYHTWGKLWSEQQMKSN